MIEVLIVMVELGKLFCSNKNKNQQKVYFKSMIERKFSTKESIKYFSLKDL